MAAALKTLHDLRKIEGSVRITCRVCRTVRFVDREKMIIERSVNRRPLDWPTVVDDQICSGKGCDSRNVDVQGVPFSTDPFVQQARCAAMRLLNLAIHTLAIATQQSLEVPDPAIQLAPRVIHPHLSDQAALLHFWEQVHIRDRPWLRGQEALRRIVRGLVELGLPVGAELP